MIHKKFGKLIVKVIVSFVINSQAFVTICRASLVSVIILANRIILGEFAANIISLHSQGYLPLCERSVSVIAFQLNGALACFILLSCSPMNAITTAASKHYVVVGGPRLPPYSIGDSTNSFDMCDIALLLFQARIAH